MKLTRLLAVLVLTAAVVEAPIAPAQTRPTQPVQMTVRPDKPDGIYQVGDMVKWTIEWKTGGAPPAGGAYTAKSGGLKEVAHGELKFDGNVATIETKFDAPNTMLVQVEWEPKGPQSRALGG